MSALEVLRNIFAALMIAALTYWIPIAGDMVFGTHFEVTFQRTSLGDKNGYLFVLDNFDSQKVDTISLAINGPLSIKSVLSDGIKPIEKTLSPGASILTIHDLLPHRRTNIIIETDDMIGQDQLRVYNDRGTFTVYSNNVIYKSLFERAVLINACLVFITYLGLSLWQSKQVAALHGRVDQAAKEYEQRRTEYDDKIQRIEQRMSKARAEQLKLKLYMYKRIADLISENEVWRTFFVVVYKTIFGNKADAERVMRALLERSGVRPAPKIGDFKEADLLEMLMSEKTVEKIEEAR